MSNDAKYYEEPPQDGDAGGYTIEIIDCPDLVPVGEPFDIQVDICCYRTSGCDTYDVSFTLAGETIFEDRFGITPSVVPDAKWSCTERPRDSVTIDTPGRHTLEATIGPLTERHEVIAYPTPTPTAGCETIIDEIGDTLLDYPAAASGGFVSNELLDAVEADLLADRNSITPAIYGKTRVAFEDDCRLPDPEAEAEPETDPTPDASSEEIHPVSGSCSAPTEAAIDESISLSARIENESDSAVSVTVEWDVGEQEAVAIETITVPANSTRPAEATAVFSEAMVESLGGLGDHPVGVRIGRVASPS